MDLNIRGVPADVAQSVKMQAVSAGVPLREWVISVLAAACTVQVVDQAKPARKRQKEGSPAPPKGQTSLVGHPVSEFAEVVAPPAAKRSKAASVQMTAERCSHGLHYHPGCSDAK